MSRATGFNTNRVGEFLNVLHRTAEAKNSHDKVYNVAEPGLTPVQKNYKGKGL
jgi:hypothetical protein